MPKKRQGKRDWKERLRRIQMGHQRSIEVHKARIEKVAAREKARRLRRSIILTLSVIFILTLCVSAALWYGKPNQQNPQKPGENTQQPTEPPSPFIYIWPDGRVEPSTAHVVKVREGYYKFVGNVSLPIIVLKDDIVLDGAGYYIIGSEVLGSRGIDVSYRENVTIINLKVKGFDYAVYMDSTYNSRVSKSEFTKNYCGIWLIRSSFNNITSNNIFENRGYALWIKNSTNNLIGWNKITWHSNYTIYVGSSNNNTIQYNTISNNRLGVFLYSSSRNIVTCNNISKNYEGISLLYSTKNLITRNDIRGNDVGIGSSESKDNTIYYNNFINNAANVNSQNSAELWDDGLSRGNYWSDYKDKNPEAKTLNGIWDTPYTIDEKNRDNYPLTKQVNIQQ